MTSRSPDTRVHGELRSTISFDIDAEARVHHVQLANDCGCGLPIPSGEDEERVVVLPAVPPGRWLHPATRHPRRLERTYDDRMVMWRADDLHLHAFGRP